MAIDSTSTLAQVKAQYRDNADYADGTDLTKARAFITACRHLVLMTPKQLQHEGDNLQLSPELIAGQMKEAQAWVDARASARAGTVVKGSFRNFRW